MKIIVPMAGMGKRMRPHTLTIPKPLLPIVGKPIVQRLVESIGAMSGSTIDEVAFIIHPSFGVAVEKQLVALAEKLGAKGSIYYQTEALGTAHAILCAGDSLEGNVTVAFADTLFKADFSVDTEQDGAIWVKRVDDPSAFGVIKTDADGHITEFVEKPATFVSDMAIIGIYYFKDGAYLKKELQYLIDNDIKDKGEYQLTNALENMKNQGRKLYPAPVIEWLDCGNKDVTVDTNARMLELIEGEELVSPSARIENSIVIPPCYIGDNVIITNAVVGPHVSLGNNTTVNKSVISRSIIQTATHIENKVIHNSMIGNSVSLRGQAEDLSIGDYTVTK
jgi:glucose-1-phosphate thymidylyltransferase